VSPLWRLPHQLEANPGYGTGHNLSQVLNLREVGKLGENFLFLRSVGPSLYQKSGCAADRNGCPI